VGERQSHYSPAAKVRKSIAGGGGDANKGESCVKTWTQDRQGM